MVRRTSVGYKSPRKVPCIYGVDTAMCIPFYMDGKDAHSSACIVGDRSGYCRVLNKVGRYRHRLLYRCGHRTMCDCS